MSAAVTAETPAWTPLSRLIVGLVAAVAALSAFTSLWLPYGWDHGIMASVGDAVVRGGLPYRDGWDMKGPFAYIPFILPQLAFGPTMWGVRAMELIILAPACWLTFRAVGRYAPGHVAALAALALYLWWTSAGWFFTGQPDLWVAALAAAAICPLLGAAPNAGKAVLAGALIACAGLVKPFYLALGLAPFLAILLSPDKSPLRKMVLLAWLAGGALGTIALFAGYLAARGGLDDAIEVNLLFSLQTYSHHDADLKDMAAQVARFLATAPVAVLTPFAALGVWASWRDRTRGPILVAWLATAFLCLAVQGKFYAYHWFPLYPPLVILAALGAGRLLAESRTVAGPIVALGACLVFLGQAAAPAALEGGSLAKALLRGDLDAYHNRFWRRAYGAGDEVRAARYIQARTEPDDTVFVWGIDATVRYLSGRADATPYTFNMPLTLEGAYRSRYRARALQALTARPPAYVVVGQPFETQDKAASVGGFPEFAALLDRDYVLETRIGNLDLYRHARSARLETQPQ